MRHRERPERGAARISWSTLVGGTGTQHGPWDVLRLCEQNPCLWNLCSQQHSLLHMTLKMMAVVSPASFRAWLNWEAKAGRKVQTRPDSPPEELSEYAQHIAPRCRGKTTAAKASGESRRVGTGSQLPGTAQPALVASKVITSESEMHISPEGLLLQGPASCSGAQPLAIQ